MVVKASSWVVFSEWIQGYLGYGVWDMALKVCCLTKVSLY